MSWKISGACWDLELPANKLMVLLAMADHADHEGNNVFPSMGLIAWKTGYSERQVRRIVKALVDDGILVERVKVKGAVTRYSINLSAGKPKPPRNKPGQNDTPDKMSYPPGQNVLPTPDIQMSDEQSHESINEPESVSSDDEPAQPQMLMKSHVMKWGKDKLTTYFKENEQDVTPLFNLLGISLAVVPVENLTLAQRRGVTWAHLWMCRTLETAGYTVGQYVAWLKQDTAWRKGAAKVTVKELMDKVAVFISNQRETPAPAPRGELMPDYTPAPVIDERTPEERAQGLAIIRAGRRAWELQTA